MRSFSLIEIRSSLWPVIAVIIMMVFASSCSQQNNDLNELKLKGKVRSVKETSFKAIEKFGHVEKGDLVDEWSLFSNFYNIYNRSGNLLLETEYQINGSIESKIAYLYDDKNKLSETFFFNSDGSIDDTWKSIYDEKGFLIEENMYEDDGNLYIKYLYVNDNNGKLLNASSYKADGTLNSKTDYMYTQNGDLSEYSEYDSSGKIITKRTYRYDKKGNRMESTYNTSNYFSKSIMKYDDKDNIIEQIDYSKEGTIKEKRTFSYTLDKRNNWTTKIYYVNDKPNWIIERVIEYYPLINLENETNSISPTLQKIKEPLPTDKIIPEIVTKLNKTAPEMLNEETRFDNALALSNKTLQYNYTLIAIDKDDLEADYIKNYIEPNIINGIRTSPDMEPLRSIGTTFVYNYRDRNGIFIYRFSITPDMYNLAEE